MMRLKLSFVLILLMLGLSINNASHAESQKELQNPTPSRGVTGKPEQKNPAQPYNQSRQDERGTENNPLVIKGIPATKNPYETEEERIDKDIKTSLDHQLNILTAWQAGFAGAMFIVTAAQVFLFFWQLRIMNDTLNSSKMAAEAARDTANSVVASERAYVFVHVERTGTEARGNNEYYWMIKAIFSNHGKTPAIIVAIGMATAFIKSGYIENAIMFPITELRYPDGLVIHSGGKDDMIYKEIVTDIRNQDMQVGQLTLHCYGFIRYKDMFNKEWITGFCWDYVRRGFYICTEHPHLNYCREYKREDSYPLYNQYLPYVPPGV